MKNPTETAWGRKRRAGGQAKYAFQLYVTGTTPKSTQAITGIKRILEERLKGEYVLEVIDIYQEPRLARSGRITIVPALVRKRPLPLRKIVGRLNSKKSVLQRLDLMTPNNDGNGQNGKEK